MKNNIKKGCLIVTILSVILLIFGIVSGYLGLFIFWFTTPGDGELRPAEKALFEKIQQKTGAKKVWREPTYHISKPKRDTTTYRVRIYKMKCSNINKDSLQKETDLIRAEIDRMNLHKNFYRYEIFYECTDLEDIKFSYKR